MVATNSSIQDPYEDVLKQILAQVAELRQKVETNANQRLLKYQRHYQSGAFGKSTRMIGALVFLQALIGNLCKKLF